MWTRTTTVVRAGTQGFPGIDRNAHTVNCVLIDTIVVYCCARGAKVLEFDVCP